MPRNFSTNKLFAILLVFSLLVSALTLAQVSSANAGGKINPAQASKQLASGSIILVDIRRPSEWSASGIAQNAVPISMHQPGFLEKLNALKNQNPGKKVALICATGGRTAFLQRELKKLGHSDVIDVVGGMFGSGSEPGWIARKLPVQSY